MKIFSINYKSTFYYFIDTGNGLLAFDAGWPGTYREYKDGLRLEGYNIGDIKWLIVSHFHMDHAGLAGWLVTKGITFFVFSNQLYAIKEMEDLLAMKKMSYQKLNISKVLVKDISESREILSSIGLHGEVIHTNGHGADCISLILDSGEAFIGDLALEAMIAEDDLVSKKNWALLRWKGAKFIKHAHGGDFDICVD